MLLSLKKGYENKKKKKKRKKKDERKSGKTKESITATIHNNIKTN